MLGDLAPLLGAISYDPIVHVPVGPLRISPHGVGIAVGFLAGARLMIPAARKVGIDEDTVYSILLRAVVGSILGARIAYVANHLDQYSSPLEVLQIWNGGISLLGGIFGGILACVPYVRKRGISAWKALDAAAPGLALGIIIGRIGDLIVGDHLGKETDLPFGYRCPPLEVATASPCAPTELADRTVGAVVHQTALYDLVLTTLLLFLLLRLRRTKRFDGFLIMVFAAWYATSRIIEDFLREDLRRFGLTGSQWTAVVTLGFALYGLFALRRTPRFGRFDEVGPGAADPGDDPDAHVTGPPAHRFDPDGDGADDGVDDHLGYESGDDVAASASRPTGYGDETATVAPDPGGPAPAGRDEEE